jgi:ABC-type lipoprotein release transport system permease subunit
VSAVWMCLRAELRSRRLAMLGIALLIGIAGGAVLTAAAGARRTDTTLARAVRAQRASDILVNPEGNDNTPKYLAAWAAVDRLPQVRAVATVDGLIAAPFDARGNPDFSATAAVQGLADHTGTLLRTIDRPRMEHGRVFDPARANEVVVNHVEARSAHLVVGSRMRIGIYAVADLESPGNGSPKPRVVEDFTVVGIGRTLDEASRAPDDPNSLPMILFTPALQHRLSSITPPYIGKAVVLKRGARDVAAFEAGVRKVFRDVRYQGRPVNMNFQESSLTVARARRAVRPYTLALWLFAALTALAGLAVVGQAIVRGSRTLREARGQLGALGFTDRQLTLYATLRGALIGMTGAVIAVVIAAAASPLMPIGPLRVIEPAPGLSIDWLAVAIGTLAIVGLVTLAAAASVRRGRVPARANVVAVSDRLARIGAPVGVVSGVRFAVDRGRDRSVPLRSTLLGITVAVAALVLTVVYGANLTRFTSTPARYGWPWGFQVLVSSDGAPGLAGTARVLAATPGVDGAAKAVYSQFDIGGHSVAAVGIDPAHGSPFLPILTGRAPVNDREIVLGEKTRREIGVDVGEHVRVTAQSRARDFRVVGTAVFPRLAPYQGSEPTGLGIGAATTAHAVATLDAQLGQPFYLVRTRPGAHVDLPRLDAKLFGGNPDQGAVRGPQRPNDVLSYDHLSRTQFALALVLVLLAFGSTVHLLVTSVRTRRRDLAVLKTLGFSRGQARRTVFVQATVLVGVAIVIAIPAGVIAGRWLWIETAHWLGIAADPFLPGAALVAIGIAAVVAANLIALGPALIASRVRPAVALRSE